MSLLRYHEVPCPDGSTITYPSITSLIEQYAFQGLLGKEYEFIPKSDAAATIGTKAHALIARINNNGHIPKEEWYLLDKQTQNAVRAYLIWKRKNKFKPKLVEVLLFSHRYGLCGHADAIGTIKRHVVVADWKTGVLNSLKARLQLAAYGFMYLDSFPTLSLNGGFRAVHLNKQYGTYQELIMSLEEGKVLFEQFNELKNKIGVC